MAETLIQRSNIRTMKKDLQRLREFDASLDRKSAIKKNPIPVAQPPEPAAQKPLEIKEPLEKNVAKVPTAKEGRLKQIEEQHIQQEQGAISQAKKYATEEEKQQIFALESQKAELEKEMGVISKEQEPGLLLEKNRVLIDQKNWQQKLNPLVQQELKIENEQKTLESKEAETNIPQEKQNLEKERWNLDDKRKEIEKQRWAIESELSKLQEEIKKLDEEYKKIGIRENSLKSNITQIDESLRFIYHGIGQRETEKRNAPVEQQKSQSNAAGIKKELFLKHQAAPHKEKPYLKAVSEAVKEKLQASVKVEEERRLRFMEDIEKWAELNKEK